jgi:hypothetical protein
VGEQQVEAREAIERAGEDEPRRAHRGLGGTAHDEREHEVAPVLVGGQIARGMHEQGAAQPLRGGEERRAHRIVEVAAPVGRVHEGAREAQLLDDALQLARGGIPAPRIHAAEADQAAAVARDQGGQAVVVETRAIGAGPCRQLFRGGLHEERVGDEGMGDPARVLLLQHAGEDAALRGDESRAVAAGQPREHRIRQDMGMALDERRGHTASPQRVGGAVARPARRPTSSARGTPSR